MTLLSLGDISKRFGPTVALNAVDLDLVPGEVRGLVGENGSGKTTLIRILAGELAPDTGTVRVDGKPLESLDATARLKEGIGVVFQEARVCPELTIAENLFLGRLPNRRGLVSWREANRQATEVLQTFDIPLDPNERVSRISQDAQHLTEVARVLARGARILAFDETTASLTDDHVQRIFSIIRDRSRAGAATIFVSHRLHEVMAICDTITVLRDGEVTGTVSADTTTEDEIISLMVGRSMDNQFVRTPAPTRHDPQLTVRGLTAGPIVEPLSLEVHAGEVVGVAGLVGSGRSTLLEAIFGLTDRTGDVLVGGRTVAPGDPRTAIAHGVGFVPEDRHTQGLALDQSLARNATMVLTGSRRLGAVPSRADEREVVDVLFDELNLKAAGPDAPVRTLSGGNQQKVVLGRWLWHKPPVLLLDEPTRGIDVGAKREIYDLIEALATEGTAILLVSSELPEVLGLSDRILVLREGRLAATFDKGVDEEVVATAMSGVDDRGSRPPSTSGGAGT